MKTPISAAKAQYLAMMAVCLTSSAALGADRLDDWSSPRPIKYGPPSEIKPPASASQATGTTDAVPPSRISPVLEPHSTLPETQPAEPRLETSRFAPEPPSDAGAEALFPVPELMLPEHRTAMRPAGDRFETPAVPSVLIGPESETRLTAVRKDVLPMPHVGVTTVSGWQLGRLASMKIVDAEQLLQRQSPMAARQQAIEALHLMAQSTDEISRTVEGTEALSQALTAIREASDFLGRFGVVDSAALQRLVDSHATRVLKRCDLTDVNPLRAADTYYEFARGRFVDAIGGWASASRALVIVAQTEPISPDQADSNLSAAQVCYLRSAVACDPNNAVAANQLGRELLALGMFDEARWALEHSYAKQPSPAALRNLAELHRVTGNGQLAQACIANIALLQNRQAKVAQVVQLTPQQFAQMSPQLMTGGDRHAAAPSPSEPGDASSPPRGSGRNTGHPATAPQQGSMATAWNRVRGIFR